MRRSRTTRLRCSSTESLFTINVPIEGALQATLWKLESDADLAECTTLTPVQIADFLDYALRSTYFQYNGSIYKQQDGAAIFGYPSIQGYC